jgi:hypothetical protein
MYLMGKLALTATLVLVAGAAATATHLIRKEDPGVSTAGAQKAANPGAPPAYAPPILRQPVPASVAQVDSIFDSAARTAWAFIDKGYVPRTGLVVAQPDWPYPTLWDVASTLAAYYSAYGLGYLPQAEYKKRAKQALQTLSTTSLYANAAFGRNYDARTGALIGPGHEAAGHGTGFSTLDIGRLLIWLKIVGQSDPELGALAQKIVARMDPKRLVEGGYLFGETLPPNGKLFRYQEGRLGYEQYSAAGFQLWQLGANRAADFNTNARSLKVNGIPLFTDKRGLDRLTSEPLILYGLEIGLNGKMADLAWQALSLQAQRFNQSGQITIASEDAVPQAPHYFYYYCIYCSGKPFVINIHTPGQELQNPRWISTKAAFAWHAILPNEYTWRAVEAVQPARSNNGWASGVYEKTNKSTETVTLNTAAVILESALFRKRGKPLVQS